MDKENGKQNGHPKALLFHIVGTLYGYCTQKWRIENEVGSAGPFKGVYRECSHSHPESEPTIGQNFRVI